MKLEIRVREVAQKKKVRTAYRLQKLAGLSPSNAANLFRNDIKQISIDTLGKLCEALDCEPNDLFVKPKPSSRSKAKTRG